MVSRQICVYLQEKKFNNKYNNDFLNMIYNLIALQAAGGNGAGIMNIGLIVILFAVFYFFMIRPQQKKQKEIKKFRDALAKGDKIITAGGIYGKIRNVGTTTFDVEISEGVRITIDKNSVYPSSQEITEATAQK
jgi:preprotein translocase subunit YajC